MNSIQRNQPEQNQQDLSGAAAVQKIRELVEQAGSCFFCTLGGVGGESGGARPMKVQKVDDQGCLWFLSAADSHKNLEVDRDAEVQLYFQGSAHSDFLALEGVASISRDRARIEEFWSPLLKTWFTGGIDDPRITVIRVRPTAGYYWDNKHGNVVAGLKMMVGAVLGKTLDDSIEGKLAV